MYRYSLFLLVSLYLYRFEIPLFKIQQPQALACGLLLIWYCLYFAAKYHISSRFDFGSASAQREEFSIRPGLVEENTDGGGNNEFYLFGRKPGLLHDLSNDFFLPFLIAGDRQKSM